MQKCLFVLLVICLLVGSFSTVLAADDNKIVVGICVGSTTKETHYIDGDPEKGLTGFGPEFLNEIAKCMNREIEYKDVAWNGLFTGLISGKWDVASSDIFITAEREEMMDFADPHTDNDLAFLVPLDAPIDTLEQLKGKILCCDTGAGSEKWLRENLETYGPYTIQTYDGMTNALNDVLTGRCDASLGDSQPLEFYAQDYKDQVRTGLYLGMGYKVGFAFRPDDPMIAEFNECQRELKKSGFLAELFEKWYGYPPQPDSAVFDLYETPYVPPAE